jgi:hypothetical protein
VRAPLILVPGTMATHLSIDERPMWPPTGVPSLYAAVRSIGQPARPGDVVREFRVLGLTFPIWRPVLDALAALGYREGVDMFVFGYDWRGDVRDAAGLLHDAVPGYARAWRTHHGLADDAPCRFVLAAHSLGTVVARWYVDELGGHAHVGHQLLVAAVDRGNPFAFAYLANGLRQPRPLVHPTPLDAFIRMGPGFASAVRQLRPLYQVLPTEPFVGSPDGPLDILHEPSWMGRTKAEVDDTIDAVRDGLRLQQRLAAAPRVPTTYLYGTGYDTISRYYVRRDRRRAWKWAAMVPTYAAGDGAVLLRTARPADLRADVQVVSVEADHQGVLRHERFVALVKDIGARVASGPDRSEALRAWARTLLADPEIEAATHRPLPRVLDLHAAVPAPQGLESVLVDLDGARRVALWGNLDLRAIIWHFARRLLDGQDARVPIRLTHAPTGAVADAVHAAGALLGFDAAAMTSILTGAPVVVFMDGPPPPSALEAFLAAFPRSQVVVRDRARRFTFEHGEARVFALSHATRSFKITLAAKRVTVDPLKCELYAAVWPATERGPTWDEHAVLRTIEASAELPVTPAGTPEEPVFHVYPSVDDEPRPGTDVAATGDPAGRRRTGPPGRAGSARTVVVA